MNSRGEVRLPISVADLRKGQTPDSLSQRVWDVLKSNPGTAFTAEELAEAVGVLKPRTGPTSIVDAIARAMATGNIQGLLARWAQRGIVETSLVEGPSGNKEAYFAAKPTASEDPW